MIGQRKAFYRQRIPVSSCRHLKIATSIKINKDRYNLKLRNISATPNMIKKVIINLDSSILSGPDCISVVALKNCESELSYILVELFNMCLKESCFPDCWKISLLRKRLPLKHYHLVSFLSVVSKIFEKLVNNGIEH